MTFSFPFLLLYLVLIHFILLFIINFNYKKFVQNFNESLPLNALL